MKSSLLVILGATGDLAKKKIFPALEKISNIKIITYSRKKPNSKYHSIIGDFEDLTPIANYIINNNYKKIYFYLAVPPNLFFNLINKIMQSFKNKSVNIALEKPFGTSYNEAKILSKIIYKYDKDNFYLVDHYIAKEAIINFIKNRNKIINKKIKSIDISLLETDRLEKRGAFFDKVGIINDTIQNHMLLLAKIVLNKKINEKNFNLVKDSIVLKQFDGYKKLIGVNPNSTTKTLFKGKFIYKDILFNFFSAKAQKQNNKFVKINFVDKTSHIIMIDDIFKNNISPHERIIKDFISNEKKYSVKLTNVLAQWRIINSITN